MKLIKLTLADLHGQEGGRPVWINPKNVCWVNGHNGSGVITFIGDDSGYLPVKETPEEVVKLLAECE